MDALSFFQSSDAGKYCDMLHATSRTIRKYCSDHQHSYEAFIGILRGHLPWHAAYNRIRILSDFLENGKRGWVCYFDSDAYVEDMNFDLASYLGSRADASAVFFHTGNADSDRCDINNGIFFLNLDNLHAHQIISRWQHAWDDVSDQLLQKATVWGESFDDDQYMLQKLLRSDDALSHSFLLADAPLYRFARQYLRSDESDLDRRIAVLRNRTDIILAGDLAATNESSEVLSATQARAVAAMLYGGILGRQPDPEGLQHYVGHLAGISWSDIKKLSDIAQAFVNSDEFRITHKGFEKGR